MITYIGTADINTTQFFLLFTLCNSDKALIQLLEFRPHLNLVSL